MTRAGSGRRWGFRTRLTTLIAAVFITGGAVLLGVQYLLVQQLFTTAIGTISTGCAGGDLTGTLGSGGEDSPFLAVDCETVAEIPGGIDGVTVTGDEDGAAILVQQSTLLSREVLSGLVLWSVVTLVAFTAVAIIAATWLSRRSFSRIAQITDTTRQITRSDLHQRLDLPGPEDEIKELGDTIDTMLDGLQEAFTRQERFIANASHELRTPLTTTRTALEIPLQRGLVPERLRASVETALAANERSEALISALLLLARSTGARPPGARGQQAVDLSAVLAHGIDRHRDAAAARDLSVERLPAGPLLVEMDVVLLQLAIDNLVDNAIRHNVDGGFVRARAGRAGRGTYVEIANSGAVLSAGEAAVLKEPFNRGPRTRLGDGGTGLGLTLVDAIAETHSGTLTISPRPGGGLVCRFDLPSQAAGEASERTGGRPPSHEPSGPDGAQE